MSSSTDTATAARMADVTVDTVRAWCRIGAVAATKVNGRWAVDVESLTHRVTLGRTLRAERTVIDLSAFRDAKTARSKAVELIETGGIVPASRPGLYLAVSSDGCDRYLIDLWEPSCTCKGHVFSGRCFHRVAASLIEHRPAVHAA
jgi:hypothetical protein